jgi:hypothetical protein
MAAKGLSYREGNEQRLIGQIQPALRSTMGAVRFEGLLAAGAVSTADALHELMVVGLVESPLPSQDGLATQSTPGA